MHSSLTEYRNTVMAPPLETTCLYCRHNFSRRSNLQRHLNQNELHARVHAHRALSQIPVARQVAKHQNPPNPPLHEISVPPPASPMSPLSCLAGSSANPSPSAGLYQQHSSHMVAPNNRAKSSSILSPNPNQAAAATAASAGHAAAASAAGHDDAQDDDYN